VKKPSPNDIRIGGGGKVLWLALVVDREPKPAACGRESPNR